MFYKTIKYLTDASSSDPTNKTSKKKNGKKKAKNKAKSEVAGATGGDIGLYLLCQSYLFIPISNTYVYYKSVFARKTTFYVFHKVLVSDTVNLSCYPFLACLFRRKSRAIVIDKSPLSFKNFYWPITLNF